MVWGASAFILMFVFCLFLSLLAACFSGQEVEDEWAPGLTRCVWESIRVRTIVCVRETHQTELTNARATLFKGPWQSCHRIQEFCHAHAHGVCHRLNIPFQGNLFGGVVGLLAAAAVAVGAVVVGWDLYQKTSEQPPQNICDWSSHPAIIICHLIRLVKIKTLCFQNSQIWRTVSGGKLASFWFVCVPCNSS